MESQPVRFMLRELFPALDRARASLANFVGAAPQDLAFLSNATTGVNTVLASLELDEGAELLVTNHAYYACRRALDRTAEQRGWRVREVQLPFPATAETLLESIVRAVTPRTRFALIDHVTSASGLVLPATAICRELMARGLFVLIDGAHAPGMLDIDLNQIGADAYVANCHKWICAPKGSAFLHVHPRHAGRISPLVTSYGAALPAPDRSTFHREFDWVGTHDPTAFLAVASAIDHMASLHPQGWAGIRQHNHTLVCHGRQIVRQALLDARLLSDNLAQLFPSEDQLGSLATVPLPPPNVALAKDQPDPLYAGLSARSIEVPVFSFPEPGTRWLRLSAQLYNCADDYHRLAEALVEWLSVERNQRSGAGPQP